MLRIVPAQTDPELSQVRNLFREYARVPEWRLASRILNVK